MSNLPLEILTDIFLRLPTKSLGRCKCVCKSWRSLVSNPDFVKLHLNRPFFEKNHLGLFLVHPHPPLGLEPRYGFDNVDINGDGDLLNPHNLVDYEPPQIDVEIVGSCNGLVCLLYRPSRFVLWNPTTKESLDIPESPNSVDDYVMLFYGFGYDSPADDYKLVTSVQPNSTSTNLFEIYGLKANTWRSIDHDPNTINLEFSAKIGTFLNGALHWVASRGTYQKTSGYKKYDVIVVFDINRESFDLWEIVKPRYDGRYELVLGVLRGSLSLYSYELVEVLHILVMNEYGVSESWTSLTILVLNFFFYVDYVAPVCYARGDEELIVDVDGNYLVRYNMINDQQIVLKKYDQDWFSCVLYVESLISPNRFYTNNPQHY